MTDGYASHRIEAAEIRLPAIYPIMLYTNFSTSRQSLVHRTELAKGGREEGLDKYLHMLVYKPIIYHQYRDFELEYLLVHPRILEHHSVIFRNIH